MSTWLGLLGREPHWPDPDIPSLWIPFDADNPAIGAREGDDAVVFIDGTVLLRRELGAMDVLALASGNPYSIIQLNVHRCSAVERAIAQPDLRPGDQVYLGTNACIAVRKLSTAKVASHLLRSMGEAPAALRVHEGIPALAFEVIEARAEELLRAALPVSLVKGSVGRATTGRQGQVRGAAWHAARGRAVPGLTLVQ
jgi:hypothetical protein